MFEHSESIDAATRAQLAQSALDTTRRVLGSVTVTDFDRPTPCTAFSVAGVGDHVARSMVLLAGCAGTHLVDSVAPTMLARLAPLAESAVSAWDSRGFAGDASLGRRTLPAADIHDIVLLELTIHSWDLAHALDADEIFDPSANLIAHLNRQIRTIIQPDNRGRAFGPAIEPGVGAPPLSQLLAFTGRTPAANAH